MAITRHSNRSHEFYFLNYSGFIIIYNNSYYFIYRNQKACLLSKKSMNDKDLLKNGRKIK